MKLRTMRNGLGLARILVLLVATSRIFAGGTGTTASWPQFHGPNRDNISTEKGLLKEWPKGGPALVWKYSEAGRGHAGVSIAKGLIFTAGDFADKEFVIALDLNGKPVWRSQNGKSWRGPQPGARTTPTYHDGVLYHMGPLGRLAAYRAESGKEIWSVDLQKEFGRGYGTWAMAENVVIDGKALLCAPGGSRGRIVALDKTNGKLIWANTEISQHAAYCTPLLVTHSRLRQMITILQKSVVSVDVRTGKLLWTHKHETKHDQNVTMPIYKDGYVYVSSGHGTGGKLLKLSADGKSVTQVWTAKDLDNCHGGVLLVDGSLYGSGCRLFRTGFVRVDFLTGRTIYNDGNIRKVSITYADGMLYCLSDDGKMSLVEAGPERFRVVSRFQVPRQKRQLTLMHPVVCGGRLYIRSWTELRVYDISASPRK